MKAKAKAPSNIAFIKYWGKKDKNLRIPMNNSISMNLSDVYTETSVEFKKNLKKDIVIINNEKVKDKERKRVVEHLERIRKLSKSKLKAKVVSKNNFPKGTGIASSASGFAALTLAATKALDLILSEKELSMLARIGSGSACRSIPDGFVEWKKGKKSESSFAYSLYPSDYWDIRDIVVIVEKEEKSVSSTHGQSIAGTSPFFAKRIKDMNRKVLEIKKALKNKNFSKFGQIVEQEAINMHAVMMTSNPSIFYWSPKTIEIIHAIKDWRESGKECYFTLDAGPNMHIICLSKDLNSILKEIKKIKGVKKVIVNKPAKGAEIIN